jgi:ankyrin repeat protein
MKSFEQLNRALIEAVRTGKVDRIRRLYLRGADVNATDQGGWSALHHAAASGNYRCTEMLLRLGANVYISTQIHNSTAKDMAEAHDHEDVVELLDEFERNGSRMKRDPIRGFRNIVVETSHRTGGKGIVER